MNAFLQKHKNFDLNVCAILFFLFLSYVGNAQVGVGTTNPLSTFEVNGSIGQSVTTVVANTTLDASHSIVVCDSGATAIALPTAVGIKGRIYTIKRGISNTAMVTITPTSSKIDGEVKYMLMNTKETVTIVSDGTNWKTISTFAPQVAMVEQFPMGEISYFNASGFVVKVTELTVDGTEKMYPCNPTGTTFSSASHGFSNGGTDTGILKYTGTTTKSFHVACTISVAPPSSNGTFLFELRKNGTTLLLNSRLIQRFASSDTESTAMHAFVTLAPGDYLELCVGAIAGNGDMMIKTLNIFAMGM